jgi:acetylornithine deacetylase/succinyl-diaminopimelate desuccinylase-like protein
VIVVAVRWYLRYGLSHRVFVPSVLLVADRINTIPGTFTVGVSVRILPGDDHDAALDELRHLRDLADPADITGVASSRRITRAERWCRRCSPPRPMPATCAPGGTITYGFALLSPSLTPDAYWSRFHGADERIDVESLHLMTSGYQEICRGLLS